MTLLTEKARLVDLLRQRDAVAFQLADYQAQLPDAEAELAEAQILFAEANAVGLAAREAAIPLRPEERGYPVSEYPQPGTPSELIEALVAAQEAWRLAADDLLGPKARVNTLRVELGRCTALLEYLEGQVGLSEQRIALHAATPPSAGAALFDKLKQRLGIRTPEEWAELEATSPPPSPAPPSPAVTPARNDRSELEAIRQNLGV